MWQEWVSQVGKGGDRATAAAAAHMWALQSGCCVSSDDDDDDYDSMTRARRSPTPIEIFGFCMAAVQYAGHLAGPWLDGDGG